MRIDVFTIFPEFLAGPAELSLLGRARREGLVDLRLHDPRDATSDRHRTVDDYPYGGGAGMVLMPEPIFATVEAVDPPRPLFALGPGGRRFDQDLARELATGGGFSLLCGRYEGIDGRVLDHLVDGELSIGDYVLAGGEVAVDLQYGPDGSVFVIDWCDDQHCHNPNTEIWDRTNGRLYRLAWADSFRPVVVDLVERLDDGGQVVAAEIVHQPRELLVGALLDQLGHRALVADLVREGLLAGGGLALVAATWGVGVLWRRGDRLSRLIDSARPKS